MIRVFYEHKSDFIMTRLNEHLDALIYKILYIIDLIFLKLEMRENSH